MGDFRQRRKPTEKKVAFSCWLGNSLLHSRRKSIQKIPIPRGVMRPRHKERLSEVIFFVTVCLCKIHSLDLVPCIAGAPGRFCLLLAPLLP